MRTAHAKPPHPWKLLLSLVGTAALASCMLGPLTLAWLPARTRIALMEPLGNFVPLCIMFLPITLFVVYEFATTYTRACKEAVEEFERLSASEDALMRPASGGRTELLRPAGPTQEPMEQLLRPTTGE